MATETQILKDLKTRLGKKSARQDCTYRGNQLTVCTVLDAVMVDSHQKGITQLEVVNVETGKSRLSRPVLKLSPSARGIVLGFCPFCGTLFEAHTNLEKRP